MVGPVTQLGGGHVIVITITLHIPRLICVHVLSIFLSNLRTNLQGNYSFNATSLSLALSDSPVVCVKFDGGTRTLYFSVIQSELTRELE